MPRPSRFKNRRRAGAGRHGPASAGTEGAAGTASNATEGKKKYNAAGRFVGEQWCASDAEAVRYEQLLQMQTDGIIGGLECQPKFTVTVNNVKICDYRADFRYRHFNPDDPDPRGSIIVEEVKGLETPEWKLKKRLVEALYGFRISVIAKLSGSDWNDRPKLSALLVGKKSSFADQIRVRYAGRVTDLPEDEID